LMGFSKFCINGSDAGLTSNRSWNVSIHRSWCIAPSGFAPRHPSD
jgi:hypothetical protein